MCYPWALVAFSSVALGLFPGARHLLDSCAFACAFYVFGLLALKVPHGLARRLLFGIVCVVPLTFHWANILFFRFFRDRLAPDAIWQFGDVALVADGAFQLTTLGDVLAGLALPLGLMFLAMRLRPEARWKKLAALGGLSVVCLLASTGLGILGFDGIEDPFVSYLRMVYERATEQRAQYDRCEADRDELFPLPAGSFRYGDSSEGLFVNHPVGGTATDNGHRPLPNVVLIFLESVRSLECGAYGAKTSFTPNLDRLAKEGLVFEQFYANAFQSARAYFAVSAGQYDNLNGQPVFYETPGVRLNTLASILKDRDMHTNLIVGLPRETLNIKAFHEKHGINQFSTIEDMPAGVRHWRGLNDDSMFAFAVETLNRAQTPFFSQILTVSGHYPFEDYSTDAQAPHASGEEMYQRYTRGVYYTDHALGLFMDAASRAPWFKNTLFVFVGDHGLYLFPQEPLLSPAQEQEAFFRVPLVFYAPGLVPAGRNPTLGSHVDLAPTLLDFLKVRAANTFLGRSLLNEHIPATDRFVVMMSQNHCMARFETNYLYGFLPGAADYRPYTYDALHHPAVYGRKSRAVGFRSPVDLLHEDPASAERLSDAEVQAFQIRAERMVRLSNDAVRNNWVRLK